MVSWLRENSLAGRVNRIRAPSPSAAADQFQRAVAGEYLASTKASSFSVTVTVSAGVSRSTHLPSRMSGVLAVAG